MRLIDADQIHHAKYHGIAEIYPSDVNIESYKRGWNDALDAVADPSCSPTIDAVPVIRCKDCKYKVEEEGVDEYPLDLVCSYWESDGLESTDFCSRGKRKEE